MKLSIIAEIGVTALCVTFAGCTKHVASAPPPPAPVEQARTTPPARPSAPARAEAPRQVAATTPRSNMPDAATKARIQDLLDRIQDAYFDYNKHILRPDAESTLRADAQTLAEILRQYPDYKLTVEGYCDERGSDEYNLALGEARAREAKDYLVSLGLPAAQLRTVSYGKERPVCTEHDEACWQKNRRAHITQEQPANSGD